MVVMSDDIKIVEREEQRTLEMQAECNMFAMPATFGRIYKTISELMDNKSIECSGAPYANYLEVNWEAFDKDHPLVTFFKSLFRKWKFIAGFPISSQAQAEGEIALGSLPKSKYVEMLHKGPYQKVGQTYKEMYAYIKENKLEIKNESIEIYTNDPKTVKATDLETIVLIPLQNDN